MRPSASEVPGKWPNTVSLASHFRTHTNKNRWLPHRYAAIHACAYLSRREWYEAFYTKRVSPGCGCVRSAFPACKGQ